MLAAFAPLQRLFAIPPLEALLFAAGERFGRSVHYAIGPSAYGRALIAISEGRIREITLGQDDEALVGSLKRRFPRAVPAKGDPLFWDAGLEAFLAIEVVRLPAGLAETDIAPAFERAVRDQLDERDGRPARRKLALAH